MLTSVAGSMRWCARVAVVALGLLALTACKKDDELAGFGPRASAVDVAKLQAPPLFAHIPADAPYVMASFEAVPLEYYAKLKRSLGPALERAIGMLRTVDGDAGRWIDAVADVLDGKWSAAGLESLGLSARPRFALYGHGALPVVLRLEIKDGKALLATIERIAHQAGAKLPPLENRHGREFWRIELPDETGAVIAIADNQLVAAFGMRHTIAAALPQILGAEKPSRSMADGAELKQLMSRHKLGPLLIGFVDAKRLSKALMDLAERKPPADCTAEIDRLAAQVPRLVFSYPELTDKRWSAAAILELAPALAEQLKALRASVPGLAAALDGKPLLAMGGGFDLVRGQAAGKSIGAVLRQLGEACEVEGLAYAGRELREAMSTPIPDPLAKTSGAVVSIQSVDFGGGGGKRRLDPTMPRAVDGFAVVAAPDAKAIFEALADLVPPLRQLGITPNGKLHDIDGGKLGLPFDLHGGVGAQTLVVAAGSNGKRQGEKALEAKAGGSKAPFFVATVDMGKLTELQLQLDPSSATSDLNASMAEIFGQMRLSLDATDAGLVLWMSGDMK